ncbi:MULTISPECIES: hypothetical protein [Rhodococcus]|uniref:Uncharacterized protein n=1 Tax=Rhodococcus oxybenzonivorans TaxID=1990687 RepID=A0AAE4UUR0_9NOCA|nr:MULTISPECIES: hypothetical protein [Rhodococcus]MDV7244223.1 hypothetical protein [Rhodococcus oxybenzonivorans]MDV7262996.1 hypothetical protein [Rhodococcus oxybenzonivorans]MDV7274535.1 hypothetical protein [Rhodococcus oxybenzonivorans]MDV7335848.1 hypothetical protein [Rhodococcus oxybenzonivorans]MDV7345485.1 hypothetical protein [Rhodococcus oxybenzonivorans]
MTEFLALVALLVALNAAVMFAGKRLGTPRPWLRRSFRDNFFRPADPPADQSDGHDAELGRLLAESHRAPHH